MTVLDLLKCVVRNMNEKDDQETLNVYRDEVLHYINEGYLDAAVSRIKPVKRIKCVSEDGRLPVSQIGQDFFEIVKVLDEHGVEVRHILNNENVFVKDGVYTVEYVYVPPRLEGDTDEPIIPRPYHYILSDYATYRMFLKGSKGRQARGDAFLQSYLNGLSKMGQVKSSHLRNKFGCDASG